MGFTIKPGSDEKYHVILDDVPPYIFALDMAPAALEGHLLSGLWLIVSISIWNGNDWAAGHHAIDFAKRYSGRFNVGLRPYDYPEELVSWLPNAVLNQAQDQTQISMEEEAGSRHLLIQGNAKASPIWATLRQGKVEAIAFGLLTPDQMEELVFPLFSKSEESFPA